eukprot:m.90946 g.90946  ORF g.90946 m.90946 type:complete len:457 (+) comp13283_c0_seq1:117-1487(+)
MSASLFLVSLPVLFFAHIGVDNTLLIGGGNVGTSGYVTNETIQQLRILKSIGANGCRTNLYPGAYLSGGKDWSKPTPENALDEFMQAAANYSIMPMILFEYYADYYPKMGFGTEEQWFGIGKVFASYVRPGGEWIRKEKLLNRVYPEGYGVTRFTAINEPDDENQFTNDTLTPGPEEYAAAIRGLARGVKSVDATLSVMPGGFMSVNAFDDCTLRGLGKHLAPLWNDGTLDGIDLHTYYDVQYAPMKNTFKHSSQANYDCIMTANNITTPIKFSSTEFNFKARLVSDEQAAPRFLTSMWDALTVSTLGGINLGTLAFPWNLFEETQSIPQFALAESFSPYKPNARGKVFQMVLEILNMCTWKFVGIQTRDLGVSQLRCIDSNTTLFVWQDLQGWSTVYQTNVFEVEVYNNLKNVSTYGWDGLRGTQKLPPPRPGYSMNRVNVTGIQGNETYMFVFQ